VKQEAHISDCIEACMHRGIRIVRGPLFDWCGGDGITPVACDATGAVLYVHKLERSTQIVTDLSRILDVTEFWLYLFWLGFDRNHQVWVTDDKGKPIRPDETCRLGITLAKRYAKL